MRTVGMTFLTFAQFSLYRCSTIGDFFSPIISSAVCYYLFKCLLFIVYCWLNPLLYHLFLPATGYYDRGRNTYPLKNVMACQGNMTQKENVYLNVIDKDVFPLRTSGPVRKLCDGVVAGGEQCTVISPQGRWRLAKGSPVLR